MGERFRRRVVAGPAFNVVIAILLVFGVTDSLRTPVSAQIVLPEPPDVTAKAIYSIDVSANVPLLEKNADEQLAPASITKIASAIVIIDTVDLDDEVTIEQSDLGDLDESSMFLVAGDVVTIQQLLYGMLLPSGNDAARSAARYTGNALLQNEGKEGDPIERFVEAMNDLVSALGLQHTHFTNPAGLSDPDNYSSARDLAALAAEALNHKQIAKIANTKQITITSVGPLQTVYDLINTNEMLQEADPGVHGLKTGTTSEAGACLIIAKWEHGKNRVITVELGSSVEFDADGVKIAETDKRYDDMKAILRTLDEHYRWVDPTRDGEMPGLKQELEAWQVTLESDASVVVPTGPGGEVRYLLQLSPADADGSAAGRVLFFSGSEEVAERPVVGVNGAVTDSPADSP